MKFRKKPVEIDAWKTHALIVAKKVGYLPEEVKAAFELGAQPGGIVIDTHADKIYVYTLEGTMTADQDDWIIRGVKGELYPCKPDIFEATYDRVETEDIGDDPVASESWIENKERGVKTFDAPTDGSSWIEDRERRGKKL